MLFENHIYFWNYIPKLSAIVCTSCSACAFVSFNPHQSPVKPNIYWASRKYSEKAMAPHSSTLAWKIPWTDWKILWTEEPGGLQSTNGVAKSQTWLHFHFSLSCIGEGNGNPLQCSCLENPRDGGAWWAVVYGIAQSRTQLKRFSSSSSSRKYYKSLV